MDIEARTRELEIWKKALNALPKGTKRNVVNEEKRKYANRIRFALCKKGNAWMNYYDASSEKILDKKIKILEGVYLGEIGKKDADKIKGILEKKPKDGEALKL